MVQKIDEALLRKRSEHNDGELSTLREVALHQYDIEKIENLDVYCRNLEILYLQSNQITKIENLHKLKRLEYLQLALNNIKTIENLDRCESLKKLDLTVNFIDDLFCIENLKQNDQLEQLFLVGNPVTEIQGYRSFVIHTLPQLKFLDGKEIEKSERIVAAQEYPGIRSRLLEQKSIGSTTIDGTTNSTIPNDTENSTKVDTADVDAIRENFQNEITGHTPQERIKAARELEQLRKKETKHFEKKKVVEKPMYGPDGRILQRNEGKYEYKWSETTKVVRLVVEISKFLDTSFINVDCHPTYISIRIKDKMLILTFEERVKSDTVHCERSKLTGQLSITVVKESFKEFVDVTKELGKVPVDVKLVKETKMKPVNQRYKNLFTPTEAVDYRNIVKENVSKKPLKVGNINEQAMIQPELDPNFIDDPDVPPLC